MRYTPKQHLRDILIGVKLLGSTPVGFPIWVAGGQFDIPKHEICLEYIMPLCEDFITHSDSVVFLPIMPKGFHQPYSCIKPIWLIGYDAAKFLDSLWEHMPFGIESSQAGTT